MNDIIKKLHAVNSRGLASKAGIDRSQFQRLLEGDCKPSPKLIGRIAAALGKTEGDALIKTYLQAVADEVAKERQAHADGG